MKRDGRDVFLEYHAGRNGSRCPQNSFVNKLLVIILCLRKDYTDRKKDYDD
jgi:hypothetical protein